MPMPPVTNSPHTERSNSASRQARTILGSLVALFTGQGARQGYLAAIDQGVISLSNFVATIILARNVDPTQLGVYGVGFVTLRLVRAVQDGIIVQPMNVFGAGMNQDEFKRYATTTSLFQIALAILSAAAVAFCGWVLIEMGNDTAGPTLYILWLPFLWWQFEEYLRRMLYTRGKVFLAVITSVVSNGARIGLMLYLADQGELSGLSGLEAIAWGAFIALFPSLWFTRFYWTRNVANLKETWQRNWKFGRWLLGSALTNWAAVEFYPILTAGLISFAAAGAYRALQNLVAPIHLLLRAIDTFLTPRAANLYERNGLGALTRTLRSIYLAIGIPVALILIAALVFPEQLLGLIYGDTYLEYSNGVILMAIFYALMFAYWPLQSIFKAAQLSRPIFIANLLAIVSMFTIGIWTILNWGVYGTIIGQAVNALVINFVLWGYWLVMTRKAAADG
ncbi:MAG: lipopolysaccharide biosynthesis protein [Anaerolineales bacterium]